MAQDEQSGSSEYLIDAGGAMVVCGFALVALMFVNWFDASGVAVNAWRMLDVADLLLFALAAVGIAAGAAAAAAPGRARADGSRLWGAIGALGGAAALATVGALLASPPEGSDPLAGAYAGALAATGLTAASLAVAFGRGRRA